MQSKESGQQAPESFVGFTISHPDAALVQQLAASLGDCGGKVDDQPAVHPGYIWVAVDRASEVVARLQAATTADARLSWCGPVGRWSCGA